MEAAYTQDVCVGLSLACKAPRRTLRSRASRVRGGGGWVFGPVAGGPLPGTAGSSEVHEEIWGRKGTRDSKIGKGNYNTEV